MEEFLSFKKVYTEKQEQDISEEFARVQDICYLDHAGATLYSEKQMQNIFFEYSSTIFANPHAGNTVSNATEDAIDIVRFRILEHFNTSPEDYTVIFTSSATGALKTIGESFNYDKNSLLAYLKNNHTSALGMRAFAPQVFEVPIDDVFEVLQERTTTKNEFGKSNSLFVYPAQSNFCGTKFPLEWIDKIHSGCLNKLANTDHKWYVVLDAASYVSTNTLDLKKYQPDFVPISFYKMFGYPTGSGAMLVKKSSGHLLTKKYYGGGTVTMVLSSENVVVPRPTLQERFEDGSVPFLSVIALKHGFETMRRLDLNFDIISEHTFSLARYFYYHLITLHHSNGNPVAILYHDTIFENSKHQGGIVNFNLLRSNGDHIGYSEVLHFANLYNIQLRTGCSCNPGACQYYLKLSSDDVRKHFDAGHVCGDQHDLVDGYPTGTVRVSFGYMSTKSDADKLLNMIETCFVSQPVVRKKRSDWTDIENNYRRIFRKCGRDGRNENTSRRRLSMQHRNLSVEQTNDKSKKLTKSARGTLERIFLYPVKSCAAFSVQSSWEITATGLKYDRQWMIVNPAGVCVTQKHNRQMCLIRPLVDLKRNVLRLYFKGDTRDNVEVPLDEYQVRREASLCQSKVCGDNIQGWDCGDKVADWLSRKLDMPGIRLLRQCENTSEMAGRCSRKENNQNLSLANKAQYLLLNRTSVEWLRSKIPENELDKELDKTIERFRPNFVVNFEEPFSENIMKKIMFDDLLFQVSEICTRCQMVCIDQSTGERTKEPLLTLSREFKGKVQFGVYLNAVAEYGEKSIKLNADVTAE